MNHVFGFYVGNSTACLAIHKKEDSKSYVEVIANNAGERVMPAIVTVAENGENVVGTACKSLMVSRRNSTFTSYKVLFDKDSPVSLNSNMGNVKVLLKDEELCYELLLETGVQYKTVADVASSIFQSLYEIARSSVPGECEVSCVLTVPKHFSETACFKIRTAAEAVGWDVLQVIHEPSAAILGYNLLSDKSSLTPKTMLVYRVGGISCEATVINLNNGMISILDSEYSEAIGGKTLISSLTDYLADEFYRKYRLDPRENHRSLMKLMLAAENCLHVLSTIESANVSVESLCDGVDFNYSMSRARFESILFKYLPLFAKPLLTVFSRMDTKCDDVLMVLLCGGVMKIPRLQKFIANMVQESCAEILPLPNGVSYDEVLACGAARQAGYIAIENMNDTFLPRNTTLSVLQTAVIVQIDGADNEGTTFPAGHPLPAFKNVPIHALSETLRVTFMQNQCSEFYLKGEVVINKDDLTSSERLSLGISGDSQITVTVCKGFKPTLEYKVKMLAYKNVV